MIKWNRHISSGGVALSDHLRVSIFDYQRAFGHEPKSITIPFWRSHEMPAGFLDDYSASDADMKFRGVPLLLSITSDLIELRGMEI